VNDDYSDQKNISVFILPFLWIKSLIVKRLLRMRARLQMGTLRHAIHDADDDKKKTGRKNMVVFNSTGGKFEPVQKKMLKKAANLTKNKSNKAMTKGRKKMLKGKKNGRVINMDRVKQIEEKSLYVTK
jgi:hypothetical protein